MIIITGGLRKRKLHVVRTRKRKIMLLIRIEEVIKSQTIIYESEYLQ